MLSAGLGKIDLAPASELERVVRAAGLGAGTDRRGFPTAEGLARDDRSRRVTVDVEVAGLDPVEPVIDLAIIQRLDPARQAERGVVREVDRLVQITGAHEPEHGAEALRTMEERAATHPKLDAWRPETRM